MKNEHENIDKIIPLVDRLFSSKYPGNARKMISIPPCRKVTTDKIHCYKVITEKPSAARS